MIRPLPPRELAAQFRALADRRPRWATHGDIGLMRLFARNLDQETAAPGHQPLDYAPPLRAIAPLARRVHPDGWVARLVGAAALAASLVLLWHRLGVQS